MRRFRKWSRNVQSDGMLVFIVVEVIVALQRVQIETVPWHKPLR